jgi:nitrate reductase gamma subunit
MTFLFMVLALLRIVVLHIIAINLTWKRTRDHNINIADLVRAVFDWAIPVKHIPRTRPVFSTISFLWHIGLIIVPIFFVSHVLLWERGIGIALPDSLKMNKHVADGLTIATVGLTAVLFLFRALSPLTRVLSEPIDYFLLVLLAVPFVTGFFAVHAAISPLPYNVTMLIHILSAEAIFILMPFTKLAHVVVFPFGRISTYIYWRFPEGSGARIADEIFGEEAKV